MPNTKDTHEKQELTGNREPAPDRRSFLKLAGALGLTAAFGVMAEACEKEDILKQATPATGSAPPPATEQIPMLTQPPAPTPTPVPKITPSPTPTQTPPPQGASTGPFSPKRKDIAHLLRRAGFGASSQELAFFEKKGISATVDYLLNSETVDDGALESRLHSINLDLTKPLQLQQWWLLRMIQTQRPLQEKMVLFWHGLLTSGFSRVGRADVMLKQNELFRQKGLGRFDVLLKDISRDPAMLIWLDSRNNRKAAPNENFARELMELFTMGPGNYSETDIREAARAFTGYFLNNEGFFFNTNQHDYGSKVFLGSEGSLDGDQIIDTIIEQPATAEFICRKLFAFFAYDDPEPAMLSRLTGTFKRRNHSIKAVMEQILTSDEFYSETAYRSRPKSPVELVAGAIRTLGIQTDIPPFLQIMTRMGQTLLDPPNVAGWPGGPTWFNSSTILERVNFANRIATDRKSFKPVETLEKTGARSAGDVVDYFSGLLLDGNMASEQRDLLYDYAASVMEEAKPDAAARAIAYLVLSSPDYQLG